MLARAPWALNIIIIIIIIIIITLPSSVQSTVLARSATTHATLPQSRLGAPAPDATALREAPSRAASQVVALPEPTSDQKVHSQAVAARDEKEDGDCDKPTELRCVRREAWLAGYHRVGTCLIGQAGTVRRRTPAPKAGSTIIGQEIGKGGLPF